MSRIEDDLAHLVAQRDRLKRLVFRMAPSFQGGHSDVGGEVAHELMVAFPIHMPSLEKRAVEAGLEPKELWPWLKPMQPRAAKTATKL